MIAPELFGSLDDVAACEQRLMNCWPSHQTVVLGDWLCRFAQGYSGRANSACGFRPGTTMGDGEIAQVENLYRDAGLPPSFRLSPLIDAGFRQRIEERGYRPEDASVGMIGMAFSGPDPVGLVLEAEPSMAWLEGACRWQAPSKRDPAHLLGIVGNIRVPTRFATLLAEGKPAAYGLISHDRGMAEFGAVMVDPAQRGKGFGRRLVAGMIGWAQGDGARRIFLQVAIDNDIARALYHSLGFADLYTAAYWRKPA